MVTKDELIEDLANVYARNAILEDWLVLHIKDHHPSVAEEFLKDFREVMYDREELIGEFKKAIEDDTQT